LLRKNRRTDQEVGTAICILKNHIRSTKM